jgi:hypothetical protein
MFRDPPAIPRCSRARPTNAIERSPTTFAAASHVAADEKPEIVVKETSRISFDAGTRFMVRRRIHSVMTEL